MCIATMAQKRSQRGAFSTCRCLLLAPVVDRNAPDVARNAAALKRMEPGRALGRQVCLGEFVRVAVQRQSGGHLTHDQAQMMMRKYSAMWHSSSGDPENVCEKQASQKAAGKRHRFDGDFGEVWASQVRSRLGFAQRCDQGGSLRVSWCAYIRAGMEPMPAHYASAEFSRLNFE